MNPEQNLPLYAPDEHATYTLEMVAEITGVSSQAILHYQEQGLLRSSSFDDEAVHTLRRIDYLRTTCETNLTDLKLMLDLLDQVEFLQTELRMKTVRGH
ncbi:MAG: MerR family transcriptional regulator [Luteolibacter sp.]